MTTKLETITLADGDARVSLAPSRGGMATRFDVGDRPVFFLDEASLVDETKNVRGGPAPRRSRSRRRIARPRRRLADRRPRLARVSTMGRVDAREEGLRLPRAVDGGGERAQHRRRAARPRGRGIARPLRGDRAR